MVEHFTSVHKFMGPNSSTTPTSKKSWKLESLGSNIIALRDLEA